jgi:hypothetical protein
VALDSSTSIQIRKRHDQDFSCAIVSENLPEQDIQNDLLGRYRIRDLLLHSRSMHEYMAVRVRLLLSEFRPKKEADTIYSPIEKAWRKTLPGQCIKIGILWYVNSVFTLLADVMLIVLPMNQIVRLKLPLSQKIGLVFVFSLGILYVYHSNKMRRIVLTISQRHGLHHH